VMVKIQHLSVLLLILFGCTADEQRAPDGRHDMRVSSMDAASSLDASPQWDVGRDVGRDIPLEADVTVDDAARASDAHSDANGYSDADPNADGFPAGTLLFYEPFEDLNLESRGWYDSPNGVISTDAKVGRGAFECTWNEGGTSCRSGRPARHAIIETETVYVSVWVKFSANWVGSERPYHPHEFYFTTNQDSRWIGPSRTQMTLYIEHVGNEPRLVMQDSLNVNEDCLLRNNDGFIGCNGDFDSYAFTEDRSAAACNGLVGDWDMRDCFDTGDSWYSSKGWRHPHPVIVPGQWHFVEAYFELNSIDNSGVGQPDGKVRYALDGQMLISYDQVLLRTGAQPDMRFAYFFIAPYIGDGSPIEQSVLYDELTVATGKP
jgi:hypothetical protein